MWALLKLIPGKDLIYGGIIVLLLAGFGWYTVHERNIGAAQNIARVTKVAEKAEAKVEAANTTAAITETQNAKTYDQTVTAPPVPNVGILCYHPRASSDKVPQADKSVTPGVGEQQANSGEGPKSDPSGPLLQRAHDADAQIEYLQGRVHELEKQMEDSP